MPLSFLLLGALFSGCLTDDTPDVKDAAPVTPAEIAALLSRPLGEVVPVLHEVLDIPTRHGSVRVDVYRPDISEVAPDWKAPVIFIASPYNANSVLGGGKDADNENRLALPLYKWIERDLVPRGYALAQMDIRGTRDSGGCQAIMDAAERQATADAIDHIGSLEWTNGKVGMIGKSYLGASQLGAAIENPEHLVTIVPISGVANAYAYHYRNGVPYLGNQATNVLYHGVYSLPAPTDDPADDPAFYATRYAERFPCMPESIVQGANPLGDYDDRWAARDYRPHFAGMRDDISVFYIHGHQDWNVKPDHVLGAYDAIPAKHKTLLIGQWAHDYPDRNNWDNDTFGSRLDWDFMLHRWFDHFLLGIDTGMMEEIASCPVQSQGSDTRWRCLDAWPPAPETGDDGEPRELLLKPASGKLGNGEGNHATWMYTDSPRTTDTDQAGVPNRIALRSDPLEADFRTAGVPRVDLRVFTTSPYNAHIIVELGVIRESGDYEWVDWAIQSLRHRDGVASASPVVPGTLYALAVDFYPLDHVFQQGERIVLTFLGGNLDGPNLGVTPNPVPGVIYLPEENVALHLPLVDEDRRFEPTPVASLPEMYWPLE